MVVEASCAGACNRPPRADRTRALLVIAGWLLFALWLPGPLARAAERDVHIVISDSAHYYQQVADTIVGFLQERHPGGTVRLHRLSALESLEAAENSLLICIGTPASVAAVKRFPHHHQLNLFITQEAWLSLSGELEKSHKATLYIEQPMARLVALARALAPRAQHYGAILGPVAGREREALAAAVDEAGGTLLARTIDVSSNPLGVLTPLMANADVFLAVPDTAVINRNIARWALHLGFKHKIPVVGFSDAYTRAGAAASIFTSTEDISRQALDWLEHNYSLPVDGGWGDFPPTYFTISVNASVARTLGLTKQSPAQLRQEVIARLEETP